MKAEIIFGDRIMPITLPDDVRIAPPGLSTSLPAADNIAQVIRGALLEPLGRPPLTELVKSDYKVTIAFDDPSVPCFAPVWAPAIKLVMAELEKAGVKRTSITLLCANGLHRKFTRRELAQIIGRDLVNEFRYRLVCHDAEDQDNLSYLGATTSGGGVDWVD